MNADSTSRGNTELPVAMTGKASQAGASDLDERVVASWMKQAARMSFFGGKK